MRPLTAAAVGLVLVVIDFRVDGLDLLADPAGWALIGWCLWSLRQHALAVVAAVGALASAGQVLLPYRYEPVESYAIAPSGQPYTVEVEVLVFDDVTGVRLAAMVIAGVALGVVVAALTRYLHRRAAGTTDPTLRVMRWSAAATVALWVVPRLVGMLAGAVGDGFDPVWNDPWWRIELAGTVAALVLVGSLLSSRREPWAIPPRR